MHSFDDMLTIGREEKLHFDIYCHSVIPSQLVFFIGKLKINDVNLMTKVFFLCWNMQEGNKVTNSLALNMLSMSQKIYLI